MSTATFTMRKATTADIEELEKLVNLAYRGGQSTVEWKNEHHLVQGPRVTPDELNSALNTEGSIVVLACTEEGAAVGSVQIEKEGSDAIIGMLAVHPQFQNFGLGRKLLDKGAELAISDFSCTTAKMYVLTGRPELMAWYKKAGYEPTGERKPFFGPDSGLTPLIDDAHFVVVSKALS